MTEGATAPAPGTVTSLSVTQLARIIRGVLALLFLGFAYVLATPSHLRSGTPFLALLLAGWYVLFGLAAAASAIPGVQRLRVDDTGILRSFAFLSKRVLWTDITGIEEKNGGKGIGWGVFVATRKGGLFISDDYSLGRAELIPMLRQRWHGLVEASSRLAPPTASRTGVSG